MRNVADLVLIPEYLRSEENGMTSSISSVASNFDVFRSFSFKASDVALSAGTWLKIAISASLRAFSDVPLAGTNSLTCILPVVMVPVLSRAIQSTRARVSML